MPLGWDFSEPVHAAVSVLLVSRKIHCESSPIISPIRSVTPFNSASISSNSRGRCAVSCERQGASRRYPHQTSRGGCAVSGKALAAGINIRPTASALSLTKTFLCRMICITYLDPCGPALR
jgi:hypothetical protein